MIATPLRKIQPILAYAAAHLDEDVSLAALAREAGLSEFHLHRAFAAAGETPKHFTLRLRLGRAAAMLLTHRDSVLDVALSCGFQSHEVFCRAFRRRFGMTPQAYRKRGFLGSVNSAQSNRHTLLVDRVSPCLGLYRMNQRRRIDMPYSITRKELSPQPVLVVRRRVKRSEIAATIAGVLGRVVQYAQQHGIALAGVPFMRCLEAGPGLLTIEPGMPVASSVTIAPGEREVISETLPGGPAATTIHAGPYERLPDAYAALEQWIEAQGLVLAGAPWECYVTDPADYPDPQDWRTEIFWPVRN